MTDLADAWPGSSRPSVSLSQTGPSARFRVAHRQLLALTLATGVSAWVPTVVAQQGESRAAEEPSAAPESPAPPATSNADTTSPDPGDSTEVETEVAPPEPTPVGADADTTISPEPDREPEPTIDADRATAAPVAVEAERQDVHSHDAAATASKAADEKSKQRREKKKQKKPKKPGRILKLYGRVMTGWEYQNERPAPGQAGLSSDEQRFFLRQARVKFAGRFDERIRLNVSVDLADAVNPASEPEINYLRNAHLTVKFHDAFRTRVGRFKRPFSRLELRGVNSIPFRGRGLSNGRVIEDLAWGDRGIGAMVYGEIDDAHLDWYLSASNPGLRVEGVDVHARLQVRPVRPLSLGANGAYKNVEDPTNLGADQTTGWGYGADARLKLSGLYVAVEGYAATEYRIANRPLAGGVTGYGSYDLPLAQDVFLQPVLALEWADANLEVSQSEAARIVVGLNLLWKPAIRVLPQVEIIRPLGDTGPTNPWLERETYYVMVTGEL